jgi:LysM repeat protein
MVASKWARYLAPIALVAVSVGTYMIVHAGLQVSRPAPIPVHIVVARRHVAHAKLQRAKVYIVQPGDSLSGIAAKTGISLPTLEALNPNVPPNSLQTGQRLRLRR